VGKSRKTKARKFKHRVWRVVAEIVVKYRDRIENMMMRDAFYFIREILVQEYLNKGLITEDDLNYYNNSYEYFRDDFFVKLERDGIIDRRPEVKEYAVYINRYGEIKPISQLPREDLSNYRGILFVEKVGVSQELRELARLGFILVPSGGQGGFPQRVVRWAFKQVQLPILVLHDHDFSGDWIYRTFFAGSKRTNHLDLKIPRERVIDLGLTEEDVKRLELPPIPEAPKYQDKRKWRWELSSLTVLAARYGIERPLYAFVVAKLVRLGFKLYPQTRKMFDLAVEVLTDAVMWGLRKHIRAIVEEKLREFAEKLAGEAVDGHLVEEVDVPSNALSSELVGELVRSLVDRIMWTMPEDVEKRVVSEPEVQIVLKLLG